MTKCVHNLLITNFSTVRVQGHIDTDDSKGLYKFNEKTYGGKETNEPIARMLIDENENVSILVVASGKVKDTVEKEKSDFDYLKECILTYANSKSKNVVFLPEINVNDFRENKELHNCATNVAKSVLKWREGKDDTKIYVDCNGGPRDFMTVLIAVLKLLKLRNIDIEKIYGINYDNSIADKEKANRYIVDKTGAFDVYSMISAMNEYMSYGRSERIRSYFNNSGMDYDKAILEAMEDLSYDISLCRAQKIEESIGELGKKIRNYLATKNAEDERSIFNYMLSEIIFDFGEILLEEQMYCDNIVKYKIRENPNLPMIISWCIKKDYIQQAATLLNESIPEYLFKNNIIDLPEYEEDCFRDYYIRKNCKKEKNGTYTQENINKAYKGKDEHFYDRFFYLVKETKRRKIYKQLDIDTIYGHYVNEFQMKSFYMLWDNNRKYRNSMNHADNINTGNNSNSDDLSSRELKKKIKANLIKSLNIIDKMENGR